MSWQRSLLPLLALALPLGAWGNVPTETACPAPGFPAGAKGQWIAPRSRVDGLPLLILQIHSAWPAQRLLHWYAHHWKGIDRHPHDILYRAGPWLLVARKTDGCFETVQVPAQPHAQGPVYLAISRPQRERQMAAHFPMPGGSQLLLTLDNGGKARARNVLLRSPDSPHQTARFYQRTLTHQGWALQLHQPMHTGEALMFQKGDRHAELSIARTPSGGSRVFVVVSQG